MLLASYRQYLSLEKRYSAHTVEAYCTDLAQFSEYLQSTYSCELEQAQPLFVRSWLVQVLAADVTPRSVNRKISSLRSFYRFALRKKAITQDPMRKVQAPKVAKRLPQSVGESPLRHLLDIMSEQTDFPGLRDRLVIELLYATGIRRAELISLTDGSIDVSSGHIRVLGKGNKERIIPIGNSLISSIEQYLTARDQAFPQGTQSFFVTDKGQPFYPRMVYNIVTKALSLVTTADKKSPHIMRHSFATHMLNAGADLNVIKELLGHANLSATQVYTHVEMDALRDIYNKAHPKA